METPLHSGECNSAPMQNRIMIRALASMKLRLYKEMTLYVVGTEHHSEALAAYECCAQMLRNTIEEEKARKGIIS